MPADFIVSKMGLVLVGTTGDGHHNLPLVEGFWNTQKSYDGEEDHLLREWVKCHSTEFVIKITDGNSRSNFGGGFMVVVPNF